jgi:hypothetical protein
LVSSGTGELTRSSTSPFSSFSGKEELFLNTTLTKKENLIFLIYKEIQMGSGAMSYIRKGLLIYEKKHKYVHHIRGSR